MTQNFQIYSTTLSTAVHTSMHNLLTKDIFERRINTLAAQAGPQSQDIGVGESVLAGEEAIDERVEGCADDRETNAPKDRLFKVAPILPDQCYDDDDLWVSGVCVCVCVCVCACSLFAEFHY